MQANRYANLDLLRGIAALGVVYTHFFYTFYRIWPEYRGVRPAILQVSLGDAAVRMFFVISGVVILLTLERSRNWRDFLIARATRIYPAYWACVVLTFAIVTAFPVTPLPVEWWQAVVNLTLFQQVVGVPNVDVVYWTLFVELTFYFWGAVALMLGGPPRATLAAILAVLVGLRIGDQLTGFITDLPVLSYRLSRLFLFEHEGTILLGHAGYFLAGITLWRVRSNGWSPTDVLLVAICGVDFAFQSATWTEFLLSAVMPVALPAVAVWFPKPIPDRLGLQWFGQISYPLYLLHAHIGMTIMWHALEQGIPVGVAIGAAAAVSILLAAVVSRQIEYPATKWLRARLRSRSGNVVPVPTLSENSANPL